MVRAAIILAAGRGTRMGALTQARPKPLLTVRGQSLIERIVQGFATAGITRAVVVTGYLGEQIEAALGNGRRWGVDLGYLRQERAEGTARALLLAQPLLPPEPFALSWGDVLVGPEFYAEMLSAFASRPCAAQLAVNETDDPWRGAAVYTDDDWRVTKLEEKPPRGTATTRWNNAGIFVFSPLIWRYASTLPASSRGEYELPQAIARMVDDGCDVRALPIRGFWSDVGTPEDLAHAERAFGR
jgi:NDP-sugar pyrophosphorylase family protein